MADISYYEVLDLVPTASAQEIKAAYHRTARVAHPDAGGTAGLFRLVSEAYETLRDPDRRAAYDAQLTVSAPRQPKPDPEPAPPQAPQPPPTNSRRPWPPRNPGPSAFVPNNGWARDGGWQKNGNGRTDHDSRHSWASDADQADHRPRRRSLVAESLGIVVCYIAFAYALFGEWRLLIPDAASGDLGTWLFADTPFPRVVVIVYTVALVGAPFGSLPALLLFHLLGAVAVIAWPIAYWDVAVTAERWLYAGGGLLWVIYNVLLVAVIATIANTRSPVRA